MKLKDDMITCDECPYKSKCVKPCKPVEDYINGKTIRKESLLKNQHDYIPQSNYNDILYELIINKESTDIERLEAIRSTDNMRRRVIMSSILVGVPQEKIAEICNISQTLISLIYRGLR